jgi:hypothetical protein
LDGIAAQGGNDYVLDYTNGTLVFVREGIVNPDTRIEIEYEYYPDEDHAQVAGASINVSPGDDLYIQGGWIRIDEADGQSSPSDLVSLHGEIRREVGDYDIRVIPGIAYQADADRIGATYLEGLMSSDALRVQAKYEDYAAAYTNLYRPQSVWGTVRDNLDLFASLDVGHYMRLTGEWRRTRGYEEADSGTPEDRSGSASLLIHPENLPSWEATYRELNTEAGGGRSEKRVIENRLKYELPSAWSARLHLLRVKTEAFLRTGRQEGDPLLGTEDQRFQQGFIRLNADVSDRFQGGFFYRRNNLYDISGTGSPPVLRSERSLLTLSHEEWPVVHLNLRAENTLDRGFHKNSVPVDASLSQYSQVNTRVFPGRLFSLLSNVDLEFNINRSMSGSGRTEAGATAWLWEVFNRGAKGLLNEQAATAYFVKSEYRPSPNLYFHTLLEWNHERKTAGASRLASHDRLWSEKLEIKLGFNTRLTIQYRHYFQDRGRARTLRYRQPSIWIEHRWTPDLQNIVDMTFRNSRSDDDNIRSETRDWSARYDLIWRRQGLFGMDRIEMRGSVSANHSRTKGDMPERTSNLGFSSSVDLYPLSSTILRTEIRFNRHLDGLNPENDYRTLAVDLKLSLKF